MSPMNDAPTRRSLGQYYKSGDWSDYWTTAVSFVGPHKLLVRGYPIDEIVSELTFTEVVYLTIIGELPEPAATRVLDAVLCSIPAHQWVASHLLAAAVTASASPGSPIPGIASGILCIGSKTVSPQDSGTLIAEGLAYMSEGIQQTEAARRVVERRMTQGELIPGLGHPNHKDADPRAEALAKVVRSQGLWGQACDFYVAVRDAVAESGKRLPVNIDGMIACALAEIGFTPMQMPGIAAIAVLPGIVACVDEEIISGVPLRIVPDELGSKYIGPAERHIPTRNVDARAEGR
jgi:citryl-CoA lyase